MRAWSSRALVLVAVVAAVLPGCRSRAPRQGPTGREGDGGQATTLTIYVPCGMTVPFHEAIDVFEAANADISIEATYDNDAELLTKVLDGGKRPDIFVSPGGRELALLAEEGLVDETTTVELGSFRIVAVVRRDWQGKVDRPDDLASDAVASIALPSPERNSMGWHVRRSLQAVGMWEQASEKIKPAGRIIEAYQMLLAGDCDLTFTYRGCPLPKDPDELARSRVRIAFELPPDSYEIPRVSIGCLRAAGEVEHAARFLQFLASDKITAMMIEDGLPDERGQWPDNGAVAEAAEPQPAGGTRAKVVIQAFFPDDDRHQEVRQFIAGLAERFPGKTEVHIHDFRHPDKDPEGFQEWKKAGLGCAGILINGKNSFTLGPEGSAREVTFQRKMGVAWTQDDLLAAVRAELGDESSPLRDR